MPWRARKPTLSDSHRPGHMSKNTMKQGSATGSQLEGKVFCICICICFLPLYLSAVQNKQVLVEGGKKKTGKEVKTPGESDVG